MKTVKFHPDLAQLIIDGKKTTTWRMFDDKDLQAGDVIELMNKATLQPFGRAVISEVVEKPLGALDDADWEGHERFPSAEAMYAAYRGYYPGCEVGPETVVKILHFDLIKKIMDRFKTAKEKIATVIAGSLTEEDPGHSENAWRWLLKLKPDADEVLQLAILGHDIERALSDRLKKESFATYDEFKSAHAKRAGQLVAHIAKESGYSNEEATEIERLIGEAEFSSADLDVQLICDADSISYFDYNVHFYLKRSGEARTKQKIKFMYERVSARAKGEIDKILESQPEIAKLL